MSHNWSQIFLFLYLIRTKGVDVVLAIINYLDLFGIDSSGFLSVTSNC